MEYPIIQTFERLPGGHVSDHDRCEHCGVPDLVLEYTRQVEQWLMRFIDGRQIVTDTPPLPNSVRLDDLYRFVAAHGLEGFDLVFGESNELEFGKSCVHITQTIKKFSVMIAKVDS